MYWSLRISYGHDGYSLDVYNLREMVASFSHHTKIMLESVSNISNFFARSSLRRSRQSLHHDPSAFCQVNLGGKCAQAGMERDQSGLVENTISITYQHFGNSNRIFWSNGTHPLKTFYFSPISTRFWQAAT